MPNRYCRLVLPDLGMGDTIVRASAWLAALGDRVVAGDRLLEVVAGEAAVDLPAPATGRLAQQLVAEDDRLEVGQLLGRIAIEDSRAAEASDRSETGDGDEVLP
jgi:pyruvate/2-oxoglutarate dehydrogenase complex dihydrolipoamide acyltransferase (E2) component